MFPGLSLPLPTVPPPTHWAAEVQLHGGQGEQVEMGQLREQLVSAFQEQMDVRRHLLELENHAMEVQIDTSRHLLTIAGYAHPAPVPQSNQEYGCSACPFPTPA